MSDNFSMMDIQRIRLERMQYAVQMELSRIDKRDLDVRPSAYEDEMTRNLVMRLVAYVCVDEKKVVKTITHPADWWQAIKARWFPAWALKRWPVQWTKHDISARVLYPFVSIRVPREQHYVEVAVAGPVKVTR